jgi:6-phosphofructokinase 1
VMIGIKNGELVYVPFKKAIAHQQKMDLKDMDIVKILSI